MPNFICTTCGTLASTEGNRVSRTIVAMLLVFAFLSNLPVKAQAKELPRVAVSKDRKGFVLEPSVRTFVPWGFNYDHDDKGRLIEDYWGDGWSTVEAHFAQMKRLGADLRR